MSRETHQHRTKAELTEDICAVAQYALDDCPDDVNRRARIFIAALSGRFERDLELTCREIADRLAAKRALQIDLMNLKRERNSI